MDICFQVLAIVSYGIRNFGVNVSFLITFFYASIVLESRTSNVQAGFRKGRNRIVEPCGS